MFKRLVLVASFSLCFTLISAQIISFAEVRDLKDSAVAVWSFEGNFKDMTDNGNDGKKLGKWDPSVYFNKQKDPIKYEILRYQKYLATLQDGTIVENGRIFV